MRIGVDIRCLLEPRYSGISEYTQALIQALADQHNAEYVFFANGQTQRPLALPTTAETTTAFFHYPNKLFNLAVRFWPGLTIDQLIGGVGWFITPNFLFSQLSDRCRKLLIVHDLSFERFPEFFTAKKRLWHHLINPQKMCRQADVIVAISENTKADIVELYGIEPNKIVVLYPGISPLFRQPILPEQVVAVEKKYQLPRRFILYLGNLEPRKNVSALIQAFTALAMPDVHLVIAGAAAWKYQHVYQLIKNSTQVERIHVLGYVAAEDKPMLYRAATVFVYPSIYEGFGLPPVEAMACGTPVVTSHSSSLPEAVGDAGLLINPYDSNELTTAIQEVLTNQTLANQLSQRGLVQSQKFDWGVVAQKMSVLLSR